MMVRAHYKCLNSLRMFSKEPITHNSESDKIPGSFQEMFVCSIMRRLSLLWPYTRR